MLTPLLLLLPLPQSTPGPDAAHFSCGPFLLQPGLRTMTIVVDNETPVPARLRYWTADGDGERALEHDEPTRHHVFTLQGLVPDTVYSYEITSEAVSTGTPRLRQ